MTDFLQHVRVLTSFSPARAPLGAVDWDAFAGWAIDQGLAALCAYNLEYRLAGANAPDTARERLLSIYQGTANDNVMKLVTLKRALQPLEGRRILLLGAAVFAESLYPHVAFRPLPQIDLFIEPSDMGPFKGFLSAQGFRVIDERAGSTVLTDDHLVLAVRTNLWGKGREAGEVWRRALPMKVFGPSMFQPSLEDALLLACVELARAGFDAPFIQLVDVRELLLGAPSLGGAYSRPLDPAYVRAQAEALGLSRAVYASVALAAKLFPETKDAAAACQPRLRPASRALLDRWVVEPCRQVPRAGSLRGADRLRRLLSGEALSGR